MNHRFLRTLDVRRAGFHERECHSQIIELGQVAYLQDVGMLRVSDLVLTKRERLSTLERLEF